MKNKNVIRKIFMISDNNNDNNTTVNILYLYLVIIHPSLQTIIIITKFILKYITKHLNYFKVFFSQSNYHLISAFCIKFLKFLFSYFHFGF